MENKAAINQEIPNEGNIAIEETERYISLMEESMKQFPYACGWMVHCAVCKEMIEEQGVEVDENEGAETKSLYFKKLEYDNMISTE